MKKYSFRKGARVKASAEAVGHELERIRKDNDGRLKARDVHLQSKPKDAPLHNEFEWNNLAAAMLYRDEQARYIIRVSQVEYEETPAGADEVVVSATYTQVEDEEGERYYTTMAHALSDDELRHQVIYKAHKALITAKTKLQEIGNVVDLLAKLDEVIEEVDMLLKVEEVHVLENNDPHDAA